MGARTWWASGWCNAAASPLAGGYPGGGGTLSAGLTFAYIAANEMACH
jgi:hypothetical protein